MIAMLAFAGCVIMYFGRDCIGILFWASEAVNAVFDVARQNG